MLTFMEIICNLKTKWLQVIIFDALTREETVGCIFITVKLTKLSLEVRSVWLSNKQLGADWLKLASNEKKKTTSLDIHQLSQLTLGSYTLQSQKEHLPGRADLQPHTIKTVLNHCRVTLSDSLYFTYTDQLKINGVNDWMIRYLFHPRITPPFYLKMKSDSYLCHPGIKFFKWNTVKRAWLMLIYCMIYIKTELS